MKYKAEIIADNMKDLTKQLKETYNTLLWDDEFIERIESKNIASAWFTRYANITSIEENDDEKVNTD